MKWYQLHVRYGIAAELPGVKMWTADWVTLLLAIVGLALIMLILLAVYRSMQAPRLRTIAGEDTPPGVRWQAVVRYLITTPFLVAFWYIIILMVITTASNGRTGEEIVVISAGVIGAARLLAHIHGEAAHELGKTVPLALLSLVLIGGSISGQDRWQQILLEWEKNSGTLDSYYWLLVIFDILVTAAWFASLQLSWSYKQHENAELVDGVAPAPRGIAVPLTWLRNFGRDKRAEQEPR